jgi:hypothetical protein
MQKSPKGKLLKARRPAFCQRLNYHGLNMLFGVLYHIAELKFFRQVGTPSAAMRLEGIVSKRAGSRYVSGRARAWLKTKNPNFQRS